MLPPWTQPKEFAVCSSHHLKAGPRLPISRFLLEGRRLTVSKPRQVLQEPPSFWLSVICHFSGSPGVPLAPPHYLALPLKHPGTSVQTEVELRPRGTLSPAAALHGLKCPYPCNQAQLCLSLRLIINRRETRFANL